MSTLQTINVKHPSSGPNNVVLDSSGNTTVSGALTVSGNATIAGTLQANGVSGTIYPLTLMTAQASTSGTFIDFTGIPSWVRRITVMFNGVSTNSTSNLLIQVGSGSIATSGYNSTATSGGAAANSLSGFIATANVAAATGMSGAVQLNAVSSLIWVSFGVLAYSNASVGSSCGGTVVLSGAPDRVRVTTVNGTDVFDAGSINVLYE